MIAVILLAAGQGTRFGTGSVTKQFLDLHGKPVFMHALDTYLDPKLVDQVSIAIARRQGGRYRTRAGSSEVAGTGSRTRGWKKPATIHPRRA